MFSAAAKAEDVYFPIIAKGFSHQFWQAVKLGAETAAKANGVTITFEAPEHRSRNRQADRHAERCHCQEAAGPRLCSP
jgi:ribose transport system substrate-binding protein